MNGETENIQYWKSCGLGFDVLYFPQTALRNSFAPVQKYLAFCFDQIQYEIPYGLLFLCLYCSCKLQTCVCVWNLSGRQIAVTCGVKNSLPVWAIRQPVPACLHSHATWWRERGKKVSNQYVSSVALTVMTPRGVIRSVVFPKERGGNICLHPTGLGPNMVVLRYETHMQMAKERRVWMQGSIRILPRWNIDGLHWCLSCDYYRQGRQGMWLSVAVNEQLNEDISLDPTASNTKTLRYVTLCLIKTYMGSDIIDYRIHMSSCISVYGRIKVKCHTYIAFLSYIITHCYMLHDMGIWESRRCIDMDVILLCFTT